MPECCGGQRQPRAVAALPASVPRTFHLRKLPVTPAVPFSSTKGVLSGHKESYTTSNVLTILEGGVISVHVGA